MPCPAALPHIGNPDLEELLGSARFYSITYRLFNLPEALEAGCEDYGQACKYLVRVGVGLQQHCGAVGLRGAGLRGWAC